MVNTVLFVKMYNLQAHPGEWWHCKTTLWRVFRNCGNLTGEYVFNEPATEKELIDLKTECDIGFAWILRTFLLNFNVFIGGESATIFIRKRSQDRWNLSLKKGYYSYPFKTSQRSRNTINIWLNQDGFGIFRLRNAAMVTPGFCGTWMTGREAAIMNWSYAWERAL